MQVTVSTIIFGLPSGRRLLQTRLTLPTTTVTVRELIAAKVRQEVVEYTAQQRPGMSGEYFSPEVLIRAERPDALAPGASHDEVERAQHAFLARDFMIVIDNQRLCDPEMTITLHAAMQIEFIKILPLVGG